ncbi:MAG: aldo/keto reductase [Dehalococcoidia bacterium]
MQYRKLGTTELQLSAVGFGVWTVATSWWGITDHDQGVGLLRQAYEKGVTFFDTADTYGNGLGETMLTEALGHVRERIVIGTKFGYDWQTHGQDRSGHKELPQDFSPDFVRRACEESLRRLNTDHIDIYQLHNPRLPAVRSDELFQTLEALKAEGKVRHYGVALGPDIGWEDEGIASMRERQVPSMQIIYSMLEPDPARAFLPVAAECDTGLLSRVPHASGLLDGTYTPGMTFDENDHRAHRRREWLETSLRKVAQLDFLHAETTGRTIGQAALQFVLAQPSITSVLPNILNLEQLDEFTAAVETPPLTQDELARIADLHDHDFYLEEAASAPTGG